VKTSPSQKQWSQIGFQVEPGDFGCEARVGSLLQNFQRNRSSSQVPVDHKHLLFRANTPNASLDSPVFEHEGKRTKILKQRLHEGLRTYLVKLFYVMLTHGKNDSPRC
jgi:hypothetical protein